MLDRIFVVAGAVVFSQIPNYFVLYTQRLGGHASELKLQIEAMQRVALKSGKTLPEFIQKFQSHTDMDISLQGNLMQGMMGRFMDLSEAYHSMLEANALSKPFVFMKHLQWSVARMTFQDFNWGISITVEGAIYGFIGMIAGYIIYSGIKSMTRTLVLVPLRQKK